MPDEADGGYLVSLLDQGGPWFVDMLKNALFFVSF